jgi:hypothetical protein
MPTSPIIQALFAFSACAILFALWKGGPAERTAAIVVAANLAGGVLVTEFLNPYRSMLQFANDGATAFALLAITLRWAAPWMGAVMLLYGGQFALHAYYMASGRDPRDYLHALMNNLNFSAVLWCLVIGAALAWRRRVMERRTSSAAAASSSPTPRRRGSTPAP